MDVLAKFQVTSWPKLEEELAQAGVQQIPWSEIQLGDYRITFERIMALLIDMIHEAMDQAEPEARNVSGAEKPEIITRLMIAHWTVQQLGIAYTLLRGGYLSAAIILTRSAFEGQVILEAFIRDAGLARRWLLNEEYVSQADARSKIPSSSDIRGRYGVLSDLAHPNSASAIKLQMQPANDSRENAGVTLFPIQNEHMTKAIFLTMFDNSYNLMHQLLRGEVDPEIRTGS